MQPEQALRFGPYRLDLQRGQLWRGKQVLRVTPRAVAVLCALAQRPGRLVTKEELFQTVWAETVVSDAALTSCMRELRQALGDRVKAPQYIETVHRRGYRFIAPVTTAPPASSSRSQVSSSKTEPAPSPPVPVLVGRDAELAHLHGWLEKALHGERQLVFVTGEPGIGKTALVESFLNGLASEGKARQRAKGKRQKAKIETDPRPPTPVPWITHGQCIEQFGEGEAYLPILSAVSQLCREPGHERLLPVLQQHAPTWLMQMPALVKKEEFEVLQRHTAGATRARMLRELAEALEVLTAEQPLVLVLEDLHWSDPSTLEFLAFLARRRQPARLLVIGTYRPVERLPNEHPLRAVLRELQLHQRCETLSPALLTEAEIAAYLADRLDGGTYGSAPRQNLARVLYQRTEGNPLFMVSLVNELLASSRLADGHNLGNWQAHSEALAREVPNNLRQFVTDQCNRLSSPEQHLLEAASLAGMTFSTATVAAALERDIIETEEHCTRLAAQQQFLRPAGIAKWPDGTLAAGYGFLHALYQQLWHERVGVSKLQQLHLRIGMRKELAYGEHAREIAAELALHFEQGGDYQRTVKYLHLAAQSALRRSAHYEAVNYIGKGLDILPSLPDSPDRTRQELLLQMTLAPALMATRGYGAAEIERVYARTQELSQEIGETPQLFPVLWGTWTFHYIRAELRTAKNLAQQCLSLADRVRDPALRLQAQSALGVTLSWSGELTTARFHFVQGMDLYDPDRHRSLAFLYGNDPGVICMSFLAQVLWLLGYPDQALKKSQGAFALAQESAHPFSVALARTNVCLMHQFRREERTALEQAEAILALSSEHGFALYRAMGTILQGWALAQLGQSEQGITQMQQGLAAGRATGAGARQTHFLALLAEAQGKTKRVEEGIALLAEALTAADKTEERYYEAELYRLKGELTLQQFNVQGSKFKVENPQSVFPNPQLEAEACFLKAIEIAQKQQAKSWELRATTSLARLWQSQGKKSKAHQTLSEIYHWFTEGFDTKDLQEAKALLESLSP